MNWWYTASDGRQTGPVSEGDLQALIAAGSVRPSDMVWREGLSAWTSAASAFNRATEPPPLGHPPAPPPVPYATVNTSPPPRPVLPSKAPGIITIPLLISAIWNCLAVVFWISTCFGIFFAVPLIVLLIFEFMLYADLNNSMKIVPPSKVRTTAVCEIVAGLVSLAPFVCGIIVLSNLGRLDINAGKVPPANRE